jgi:SH3-like domain-containing protein
MPQALRLDRAPRLILALILAAACLGLIPAASPALGQSGLPVPRFVSLHSPKVNVRTGPGVRYPVEWVLVHRGIPVEIIAEFEHWRKIRDWQGTEGWVHQSMLSGTRTAVVMIETRALRRSADDNAPVVAKLEPGVVGRVLSCAGAWCRLEVSGFRGWIKRADIWGVGETEEID